MYIFLFNDKMGLQLINKAAYARALGMHEYKLSFPSGPPGVAADDFLHHTRGPRGKGGDFWLLQCDFAVC